MSVEYKPTEADDENTLDVDGLVDEVKGVRYFGKARRQENGMWRCLAEVNGCMCLVEAEITPVRSV